MSYLADPETFWLDVTNFALGAVTLFLVLLLVRTAFRDICEHRKNRHTGRLN